MPPLIRSLYNNGVVTDKSNNGEIEEAIWSNT